PQHVGGLIMLDTSAGPVTRTALIEAVTARLGDLPRLTQRLSAPHRWHRPRWVAHPALDWDWHVAIREAPAGPPGDGVPIGRGGRGPRGPRRAAAIALGIWQLATARRQDVGLGEVSDGRGFAALAIPFEEVRAVARARGVRVSDVLLCTVAGALRREAKVPER